MVVFIHVFYCTYRTLPAGYMEIGESAAEGAIRETWEEANAEVEILSPFAQLDIPLIGQVSHVHYVNCTISLHSLCLMVVNDFDRLTSCSWQS